MNSGRWFRSGGPIAIAVALIAALVAIAGCEIPHSVGLVSTIGTSGTRSTTNFEIGELPDTLTLAGAYEVIEGSLSATVRAPDGRPAFAATWYAGERGRIDEALTPLAGTWTITVESPGGGGSYEVRVVY
jgi:hypothetical protein